MKAVLVGVLILLAHEPYTGLKSPTGRLCCDGIDCAPYPAENVREVPGGYRLHDGVFVATKDAQPSPDGQFHRCGPGKVVICLMIPLSG